MINSFILYFIRRFTSQSQSQMAERLDVSLPVYRRIENNKIILTPSEKERLCSSFGISVSIYNDIYTFVKSNTDESVLKEFPYLSYKHYGLCIGIHNYTQFCSMISSNFNSNLSF